MTLRPTEEQEMLRGALSGYLRNRAGEASQSELWRSLAVDLGIGGAFLPVAHDGLGGGPAEAAVLMGEVGAALVAEPVLETFVLPAALAAHAEQPVVADLFRRILDGSARLAWADGEAGTRFNPAATAALAVRDGDGYRVDGRKTVVIGAPSATDLVVVLRTGGEPPSETGLSLFLVAADTPGLAIRAYRLIDGRGAGDVTLTGVRLGEAARIGAEGEGWGILDEAIALGLVGTCAEMAGALRRMIGLTADHVRERQQFGRPLASFQALRHHLVDAWAFAEQADAMVAFAVHAHARSSTERAAALSAAKVFLGHARQFVGRYAIQFHGAMGTTNETPVSRYFKRVATLEARFGSADDHLRRYVEAGIAPAPDAVLNVEEASFRMEVRAFLADKLTTDLRARTEAQAGFICEPDLHRDWQNVLRARGWDVPLWPVAYGGTGWTPVQRYIFQSELAAAGAPFGAGMGANLCAPVLIEFGTEEQKAHFLPRIRTGEDYWAQGFSEPGSGSDLASLQMRAVRDGDDYVVNGSKIWTTHAHHANWIFLLLRTSLEARKQEGLSFLLCLLEAPGITVRPITSMSGEREVNQLFFDDVRVPASNRVGEEGQGWDIARYLLGFERGGRPFGAGLWRRIDTVRATAALEPDGRGGHLLDDPVFRHRLAETEIRLIAADWTERMKRLAQPVCGTLSVADASLLKLLASERTQEVQELTMDVLGPYAAADQRDALKPDVTDRVIGPDHALTPTARYLNGRAYTIFGGASEVQRDILARAALALD